MTAFAGIDYDSNRVDLVTIDLDTGRARWARYRLDVKRGEDAFERCRRVRDAMPARSAWNDDGVVQLAIEAPRGQQKGSAPLLRVQGAILACLPTDLPVFELAPWEWRGALGLPGSGKREAVKGHAREYAIHHGAEPDWPQDAIDGFCIAKAAIVLCERGAAAA